MICNYFCVRFTALKFKVNKSQNKRSFNSMNVNTWLKDVGYTANAKTTQQPEKKTENNLFEIFFLVVGMFFHWCVPHIFYC